MINNSFRIKQQSMKIHSMCRLLSLQANKIVLIKIISLLDLSVIIHSVNVVFVKFRMIYPKCGLLYKQLSLQTINKSSLLLNGLCTNGIHVANSWNIEPVTINRFLPQRKICTSVANLCNEKQQGLNHKNKIGKTTINYNEFESYRLKGTALIIDVRSPEELKKNGDIPNTINIPVGLITSYFYGEYANDFDSDFGVPLPGCDDPIIFFCKMGVRSEMARKLLTSAPSGGIIYRNVASYEGSFDEWNSLSSKTDNEA